MVLVVLTSDNYEEQPMTVEAYEEVVLTMSTGDFCTHTTRLVVCPQDHAPEHLDIYDLEDLI